MSSEGFVKGSELVLPLGKAGNKSFNLVSESDDFALKSEDFVGSFSDLGVEGVDSVVVFCLSLDFSGGFRFKTISFVSEQVIDDFND